MKYSHIENSVYIYPEATSDQWTMWPDTLVFFNISNSLHSVLSIWMQRKLKTPQPLTLFESNGCFLFEHAVIWNTSPFKVIKKKENRATKRQRVVAPVCFHACKCVCVCVLLHDKCQTKKRNDDGEKEREEKKIWWTLLKCQKSLEFVWKPRFSVQTAPKPFNRFRKVEQQIAAPFSISAH